MVHLDIILPFKIKNLWRNYKIINGPETSTTISSCIKFWVNIYKVAEENRSLYFILIYNKLSIYLHINVFALVGPNDLHRQLICIYEQYFLSLECVHEPWKMKMIQILFIVPLCMRIHIYYGPEFLIVSGFM